VIGNIEGVLETILGALTAETPLTLALSPQAGRGNLRMGSLAPLAGRGSG
jgi:hypothetical protein